MATFVLVSGAWQGGWCWARVAPRLRAAGHDVQTPTLTGLGDRAHLLSPLIGLDTHVADVVATLDREGLGHVVLVGHSYGGQVITATAARRPERLAQLVYLDAFVPEEGDRAIDLLPESIAGHYRESVREQGFGWLIPPRSLEVLGVTDPVDIAWLQAHMGPHPWRTYTDPVDAGPGAVPSAFVECTDWMGVFAAHAERSRSRGWPVHELRTGHEAMVTAPAELAQVLDAIAEEAHRG